MSDQDGSSRLEVLFETGDTECRDHVLGLLSAAGEQVAVCTGETLADARKILADARPDVLLLDGGVEEERVTAAVRERLAAVPGLPIVVLADGVDAGATLRAGAQDSLPRSIADAEVLLRALRHARERNRAEAEIRRRKAFIETVLDHLPIGLAVNRAGEGRVTYVNARFEEIYGWPREELEDVPAFFERVYPDPELRREMKSRILEDIASGDPERMQWENVRVTGKDGRERVVIAKNIPLPEQDLMISTVQDVTSLVRVQEELREGHALLERTLGSLDQAVFVIEPETRRILRANEAACRIFGYEIEEMLGKTTEFLHVDRERFQRFVDEGDPVITEKGVWRCEFEMSRRDGSIFPTEHTVSVIRGKEGEWEAAVSVVTDLTELKAAEEERDRLQVHLAQSQKMEAVGLLAGGVAHDFNNLLMVILGQCDLGLRDLAPDDPVFLRFSQIRSAGDRAASLTRQLLAFSRKQVLRPEVLDLNAVVEGMLDLLRRLLGEDIRLTTSYADSLDPVLADSGQLEQVVMNLAVNAREAMPRGGKITIETSNVVLDERYVGSHEGVRCGPHVLLAISDTGMGMDSETRRRAFEPFFTRKQMAQGTGLGLSTVHGIVKQSGGDILIHSEPGRGTTIKVYLPRTHEDAAPSRRVFPRARSGDTDHEILVVEDEPAIRDLLEVMLTELGYRVRLFGSGERAVAEVEAGGRVPDLLLTDVVMPGMSGVQLAARLGQTFPDLKVLYMSGYTDEAIRRHGLIRGSTPLLGKPFSLDDLARKIEEVLRTP